MITITNLARQQIKNLIRSSKSPSAYLYLKGGGCNGFTYMFSVLDEDKKPNKLDEVQKIDEDHAQQKQADELQAARNALVIRIKTEAGQRITSLNWKVDRARERDVLNRTSTLQEVYAEREAIRAASNEAETAIAELAFFDDIRDFTW